VNLKPHGTEEPEVNLTSLIDVVLLLLVFFMVSTTFIDEARIRIDLPQASVEAQRNTARDPIEISVTAQGGYRVNGKSLINTSPKTLSAAVSRVAGERRDMPITIRADARAMHQSVVTALDVVGRLGFRTVNIATVDEAAVQGGQ
jgi:biopolymer transport protein ExbD